MKVFSKIAILMILVLTGIISSCKEYYDDLQDLGNRVVKLEEDSLKFTNELDRLEVMLGIMDGQNKIDSIYQDANGNWVLLVANGSGETSPITLEDGKRGAKGNDINFDLLTVKDSLNGKTYWFYDGDWLRNSKGNPVEVIVIQGKDKNTDPRTITGVPVIRINKAKDEYEITYDTQYDPSTGKWEPLANATWIPTGVKVQGQRGDQGPQGSDGNIILANGEAAPYLYTYISQDGKYLIIVTVYGSYAIEISSYSK